MYGVLITAVSINQDFESVCPSGIDVGNCMDEHRPDHAGVWDESECASAYTRDGMQKMGVEVVSEAEGVDSDPVCTLVRLEVPLEHWDMPTRGSNGRLSIGEKEDRGEAVRGRFLRRLQAFDEGASEKSPDPPR